MADIKILAFYYGAIAVLVLSVCLSYIILVNKFLIAVNAEFTSNPLIA